MYKLMLLAGAALIAVAPAQAKPGAHGNAHANAHGTMAHAQKAHVTHRTTAHRADSRHMITRRLRDRDRDGIDDRDEALAHKYGGALCPPGLAKKTPACMPPGQAKRLFREGQRVTRNYRYYTPFGDIPMSLRDRYDLSSQNRYIYRDNVIYVVDPRTRLISDIINAVL